MKNSILLSLLILFIISFSCSTPSNQRDSAEEQTEMPVDTATDVTQLTFTDVRDMVFDDEGEGVEWHGEEMPNTLISFLTIEPGAPCGEGDCGNRLSLTSSAEKTIELIIKGDYDIKGDQGYMSRKYTIAPGATLMIGCSHLCYGGESFEFLRTIVGSAYTE